MHITVYKPERQGQLILSIYRYTSQSEPVYNNTAAWLLNVGIKSTLAIASADTIIIIITEAA